MNKKSSCVSARGIPPAAKQVFAVLICPGRGGGYLPPTLTRGVPTLAGRIPTLSGGTYPIWVEGTYPGWVGGTFPGWGTLPPGVDRQTPVKTVPSPILRMRAVIMKSDNTNSQVTASSPQSVAHPKKLIAD